MSTCMYDISPVYMMSHLRVWCLTSVYDVWLLVLKQKLVNSNTAPRQLHAFVFIIAQANLEQLYLLFRRQQFFLSVRS